MTAGTVKQIKNKAGRRNLSRLYFRRKEMYVCGINKEDAANGPGIRLSLFVSGCTNHCKGCFSPETWNFDYGYEYTDTVEDMLINELKKPYYEGLTILGGEPFEPSNQEVLVGLIRRVKRELPEKTIWMFSGNTYDDLSDASFRKHTDVTDEIFDTIDVLVDGPFDIERRDVTLAFRGSSNQRIVDMKKTRKTGSVTTLQFD